MCKDRNLTVENYTIENKRKNVYRKLYFLSEEKRPPKVISIYKYA